MSIEQFTTRIALMPVQDLESLVTALTGHIAVVRAQVDARGKEDLAWYRRARHALGYSTQKRHLLIVEVQRRHKQGRELNQQRNQQRKEQLVQLREMALRDQEAALLGVIDWLLERELGR